MNGWERNGGKDSAGQEKDWVVDRIGEYANEVDFQSAYSLACLDSSFGARGGMGGQRGGFLAVVNQYHHQGPPPDKLFGRNVPDRFKHG